MRNSRQQLPRRIGEFDRHSSVRPSWKFRTRHPLVFRSYSRAPTMLITRFVHPLHLVTDSSAPPPMPSHDFRSPSMPDGDPVSVVLLTRLLEILNLMLHFCDFVVVTVKISTTAAGLCRYRSKPSMRIRQWRIIRVRLGGTALLTRLFHKHKASIHEIRNAFLLC